VFEAAEMTVGQGLISVSRGPAPQPGAGQAARPPPLYVDCESLEPTDVRLLQVWWMVASNQQIFDFYGQLADTHAGGVVDGGRDRGGNTSQTDFTDAPRAKRV
jgi:hypothetical protein